MPLIPVAPTSKFVWLAGKSSPEFRLKLKADDTYSETTPIPPFNYDTVPSLIENETPSYNDNGVSRPLAQLSCFPIMTFHRTETPLLGEVMKSIPSLKVQQLIDKQNVYVFTYIFGAEADDRKLDNKDQWSSSFNEYYDRLLKREQERVKFIINGENYFVGRTYLIFPRIPKKEIDEMFSALIFPTGKTVYESYTSNLHPLSRSVRNLYLSEAKGAGNSYAMVNTDKIPIFGKMDFVGEELDFKKIDLRVAKDKDPKEIDLNVTKDSKEKDPEEKDTKKLDTNGSTLNLVGTMFTYHRIGGYHGFFKPSYDETVSQLMQISKFKSGEYYFWTDVFGDGLPSRCFLGDDLHVGVTYVYSR